MFQHLSLGRRVAIALAGSELLLLYAPTVLWLWSRWTMSVWQHAHGLLIPPVVAYLVYEELKDDAGPAADDASPWGFALLVPALALLALDAGMHTELLSAISLVIAMPGLSLLLLGMGRTKRILIPLLFLAFALPIPLSMTESIHLQLRHVATAATAAIVPWLGVSTYVEGTTIVLARGQLEVADACSGFSTLYASVAVATLLAYSMSSNPRRVALVALSVPIAIVSNVARVVLLVVLVAAYGPAILDTMLHPLSGLLTFVLSLPLIVYLSGVTGEARA